MTSRARVPALAFVVLLALVGLVAGPAPALAHQRKPSRTLSYVALGDSYAAGQGAGHYRNDCLQSRLGYPARLDATRRIHLRANATCTGATTTDVVTTQLASLKRGTKLVTLTVGGNDLHVADIAAACAAGPSPLCQAAIDQARALLAPAPPAGASVLGSRLVTTYAAIATAAPKARIIVTGYPYLFEAPSPTDPSAPIIAAINEATTALNATIAGAVAAAAAGGATISYVDVTAGFAGHGIGSAEPFLNTSGPDAFHPTASGYRVYATAIRSALSTA